VNPRHDYKIQNLGYRRIEGYRASHASPVFGARLVELPEGDTSLALAHYQAGFKPLLYGIIIALILTFFLRETGPATKKK
jgi:hypothetical protein